MSLQQFSTKDAPTIRIEEVLGNLRVRGWERAEVSVDGMSATDLLADQTDDQITIRSLAGCELRVPHDARLSIASVHGDVFIDLVHASMSIGTVAGSLHLRDVGETHGQAVGGDLLARTVSGDLRVETVGRHARVSTVKGQFASSIGGHLHARDIEGGVTVEVGGRAALRLELVQAQIYSISAGGKIYLRLLGEPHANLKLNSGGRARVAVGGQDEALSPGPAAVALGGGGGPVHLTAGGPILVVGEAADGELQDEIGADFEVEEPFDLGEEVSSIAEDILHRVEHHLDSLQRELHDRLAQANLDPESAARVGHRIRRAERKIATAQRKFARQLARSRRRAERRAGRGQRAGRRVHIAIGADGPRFEFDGSRAARMQGANWTASSTVEPNEPVSDDERMAVLRMVEDGKISAAEAERLLAALEGEGRV